MKKLSLFQIILMSSCAALAVAGVIVFAVVTNTTTTKSLGPVVIWGTLDQAIFNSVLQRISENDDTYKSVSYVQKDLTTFESDLTSALAEGGGPDVFLLQQDHAYTDAAKI